MFFSSKPLPWRLFLAVFLISSLAHASGTNETPIPYPAGSHANDHFGDKVRVFPDLNGDGKPEMVVRDPFFDMVSPFSVTDLGKFTAYGFSIFGGIVVAKDFTPQFSLATPLTPGFAADFDSVGDINADGKPDVAVGWPAQSVFGFHGQVVILSGLNGTLLRHKEAVGFVDYGTAVVGLGDINGDGKPDLAVSAPEVDVSAQTGNYVEILSSVPPGVTTDNLTSLRVFTPTNNELRFGQRLFAADTDGDGKLNLIIASTGSVAVPGSAGFAIVDPSTSQAVQTIVSVTGDPMAGFAQALAAADIDGDGKAEIAIGSPEEIEPTSGLVTGSLRVYNAQGNLLHTYYGPSAGAKFASSISIGPDFDADGKADWVVGCPGIHTIQIVNSFPIAGTGAMYSYASASADSFGASVASADFDGNGVKDILVGAPDANGTFALQGRASMVTATCDGTSVTYGQGCAPIGGTIPSLTGQGCPTGNGNLTLHVQNGPANAATTLVFGLQQAAIPIGGNGCQLLVTPLLPFSLSFSLSGAGSAEILFPLPSGLQGQNITMQAFVADPNSGSGYDTTNGLQIQIGS